MAKSEAVTGICLHQLIAREEAVIKRVIAFSSSQGRNYQPADLQSAQIVIVSDDTPVDFDTLNPDGCMIVRIAAAENEYPHDVLMTRPLLVTRVMRTLDDAVALLQNNADTVATAEQDSSGEAAETAVTEKQVPEDEDDTPEGSASDDSVEEPVLTTVNVDQEEPESQSALESAEVAEDTETEDALASDEAQALHESGVAAAAVETNDADNSDGDAHHKALVVDDSAAIRKQLELELRDAGISADFAEDGEQALEKVAANHYDLIFLDIIMPGMDGYEACRQMRLRAELKKTPIIMLSAKTSPLDEVQGVIAGASTYLTKPVKSEQLQTTLKRVSMWIDNFQAST